MIVVLVMVIAFCVFIDLGFAISFWMMEREIANPSKCSTCGAKFPENRVTPYITSYCRLCGDII